MLSRICRGYRLSDGDSRSGLDYQAWQHAETLSIRDDIQQNSLIFQAFAEDADEDPLIYSISGVNAGLLSVEATTGKIFLNDVSSLKSLNALEFSISASDGTLTTTEDVFIKVTEPNEIDEEPDPINSAPIVSTDLLFFSVDAGANISGAINASDPDEMRVIV